MRFFILTVSLLLSVPAAPRAADYRSHFPDRGERTWAGPGLWANRLQDWRVANGRLECIEGGAGKPLRTVHLVTHRIEGASGSWSMGVETGLLEESPSVSKLAASGFLIGAGGSDLDYRAASLVHHSWGNGAGLFAGIDATGRVFFHDLEKGPFNGPPQTGEAIADAGKGIRNPFGRVVLYLTAHPVGGGNYLLTLTALEAGTSRRIDQASIERFGGGRLRGNLALVSHPGQGGSTGRWWFKDWEVKGSGITHHPENHAGPVIGAQYTLHDGVLKLTAQLMPIGRYDSQVAYLQTLRRGTWRNLASTRIVVPGWTAPFRIEDWNDSRARQYRVLYQTRAADGELLDHALEGVIQANPKRQPEIAVAGFTGNHNTRGGVDGKRYDWSRNAIWFPHGDLVRRVKQQKPDVLFFSGDQVYEGASPTRAERGKGGVTLLDYLYKWYLFSWAWSDLTRDLPAITIPDDHDVFQPNLWGHSGRPAGKDDEGGYVESPEFVKLVERTQTSHLPDPYDPAPIGQGIGVYYTQMTYGGISFAIIEDRKFKSGVRGFVPPTGTGRPDHVKDPNFDPGTADLPGATLLGERQLKFLRDWSTDWRDAEMKIVVSQTVFGNLATHHGGGLDYLVADYDSNGWPQAGRARALHEFRRAFAFMLGGDQHLATLVQHGIDDWDDAGWSFAVPSIANFYPRAWMPPERSRKPGDSWPENLPDYTGRYRDGFGNPVTLYGATNPGEDTGHEPKALHNRMPGYGIVRMNKKHRTYTVECWPRHADPGKGAQGQYPGWPRVIPQRDNYGREARAWLPTLKVRGMTDPVVTIADSDTGELVYSLRIKGTAFQPWTFKSGLHDIVIGEPGTGRVQTRQRIRAAAENPNTIRFEF